MRTCCYFLSVNVLHVFPLHRRVDHSFVLCNLPSNLHNCTFRISFILPLRIVGYKISQHPSYDIISKECQYVSILCCRRKAGDPLRNEDRSSFSLSDSSSSALLNGKRNTSADVFHYDITSSSLLSNLFSSISWACEISSFWFLKPLLLTRKILILIFGT